MPTTTFTRAKAEQLLNAAEMNLFGDSRVNALRKFSASQLDQRVTRARAARDRARDLLQRQRVAQRDATGSKRGASGTANQQRSKDKAALLADILKRFEGQLKVARRNEKAGILPKAAPKKRVGREAAISKARAPDKDFTASRMRNRQRAQDDAADTMQARKQAGKTAAKKAAAKKATDKPVAKKAATKKAVAGKPAAAKTATTKKAAAAKAPASKRATRPAPPAQELPGGATSGKRTANLRALNEGTQGGMHAGYPDNRAQDVAQHLKLEAGRKTPIQAHISSRGRRAQGRRDNRG